MNITPDIQAALGAGPELTEEEHRLLEVLLDPENDSAGYFSGADDAEVLADMLAEYTAFGGLRLGTHEAQRIADTLRTHYDRKTGFPEVVSPFTFGFDAGADGDIGAFEVGPYLGHDTNAYLLANVDAKYLMPREVRGLRAALKVAEVIDSEYQRTLVTAKKLRLVDRAEQDASILAAAQIAADAAYGDSNDAEIDALREALEAALSALGLEMPEGRETDDEDDDSDDEPVRLNDDGPDYDGHEPEPNEAAPVNPCSICHEYEAQDHDMCASCLHDALRSGWDPDDDNKEG